MYNCKKIEKNSRYSSASFIEYKKTKDPKIREFLILNNKRLVISIAKRFRGRGEPLESLISVGMIGLINAVDNFDLDRNIKFSTYATSMVVGEIKHYFRSQSFKFQVPRKYKELYPKVYKVARKLAIKFNKKPKISDIAKELNETEESILEAMELKNLYRSVSLSDYVVQTDSSGMTMQEKIGRDDENLKLSIDRVDIKHALSKLNKRERIVVDLFFLHEKSQEEIAHRLNISQMHISRILKSSVITLKKYLTE